MINQVSFSGIHSIKIEPKQREAFIKKLPELNQKMLELDSDNVKLSFPPDGATDLMPVRQVRQSDEPENAKPTLGYNVDWVKKRITEARNDVGVIFKIVHEADNFDKKTAKYSGSLSDYALNQYIKKAFKGFDYAVTEYAGWESNISLKYTDEVKKQYKKQNSLLAKGRKIFTAFSSK